MFKRACRVVLGIERIPEDSLVTLSMCSDMSISVMHQMLIYMTNVANLEVHTETCFILTSRT